MDVELVGGGGGAGSGAGALGLEARLDAAEKEVARQRRVIAALMRRVEREVDSQGGAFGVFANAIALEEKVQARTRELANALEALHMKQEEQARMESELMLAHKLEGVGQLAAGIAHEINTPIQFIGDSARFLEVSTPGLFEAFAACRSALKTLAGVPGMEAAAAEAELVLDGADVDFTLSEVPRAVARIAQGVSRVSVLVKAMKEFGHPGQREKTPADINHLLQTTLTVAHNEYKYVADIETEFGGLPPVPCVVSEVNQVFLNLLVNAAHAVGDKTRGTDDRGLIQVSTHLDGEDVVIRISDSGAGIPESIRNRVFDPFFTTKPPGKGTGQGLAIARSIVVDRHGGALNFTSEPGEGTTFTIRLPVEDRRQASEVAA
jgi:signal transduction histidine kinase